MFCLASLSSYPHAQSAATDNVSVKDVAFRNGEIHGVLKNNASHRVRDVELLIRYFWVWKVKSQAGDPGPKLSLDFHNLYLS